MNKLHRDETGVAVRSLVIIVALAFVVFFAYGPARAQYDRFQRSVEVDSAAANGVAALNKSLGEGNIYPRRLGQSLSDEDITVHIERNRDRSYCVRAYWNDEGAGVRDSSKGSCLSS